MDKMIKDIEVKEQSLRHRQKLVRQEQLKLKKTKSALQKQNSVKTRLKILEAEKSCIKDITEKEDMKKLKPQSFPDPQFPEIKKNIQRPSQKMESKNELKAIFAKNMHTQ